MNSFIVFSAKYLFLVSVILLSLYFFRQTKVKKKSMLVISAIYFPLTYIAAQIGAYVYFDTRPFVIGNFTPLIAHIPDNGFPSDHMLFMSAIACLLFSYDKRWGSIAWIAATMTGISRVQAGIHHTTDILGSVAIAVILFLITKKYILSFFLPKAKGGEEYPKIP